MSLKSIEEYLECFKIQRDYLQQTLYKAEKLGEWDCQPPVGISLFDWYSSFSKKLIDLNKKIILVSNDINIILEQTPTYKPVVDYNDNGVHQVGTLGNLLVFVDPYFPVDQILLGLGSLDDPNNLNIRESVKIRVKNILDTHRNNH